MRQRNGEGWVFGYGSLVWRPDFPHLERRVGAIRGWNRRFWQGSPDHRGRPEAPGRVVTLVEEADAVCWGVAYRVSATVWDDVVVKLDDRESGGFERHEVEVRLREPTARVAALVYVAGPGNPNFLGPAPLEEMAAQMRTARGKSGANSEYVLRLASALREIDGEDEHVVRVAAEIDAG